MSELAAVVMGFGILLMNGACVYKKACSGLRVHQATHLGVEELAVATALFLRLHNAKSGIARRHFDVTQREAWDEALRWVDSNDAIIAALKHHPESLQDGAFAIEPIRGFLTRLFTRRNASTSFPGEESFRRVQPKRAPRTHVDQAKLADVKALVDEVLGERG